MQLRILGGRCVVLYNVELAANNEEDENAIAHFLYVDEISLDNPLVQVPRHKTTLAGWKRLPVGEIGPDNDRRESNSSSHG